MSLYTDWRHGRGFGVHSPWAYAVIAEALRNPCTYYNEDAARRLMTRRSDRRAAGAVFRIIAHQKPSSVTVFGTPQWHEVARLAGSLTPTGQRLVIVAGDGFSAHDVLAEAGANGLILIVRSKAARHAAHDILSDVSALGRGFVLDTLRTLVLINLRHDLPHQHVRALF